MYVKLLVCVLVAVVLATATLPALAGSVYGPVAIEAGNVEYVTWQCDARTYRLTVSEVAGTTKLEARITRNGYLVAAPQFEDGDAQQERNCSPSMRRDGNTIVVDSDDSQKTSWAEYLVPDATPTPVITATPAPTQTPVPTVVPPSPVVYHLYLPITFR